MDSMDPGMQALAYCSAQTWATLETGVEVVWALSGLDGFCRFATGLGKDQWMGNERGRECGDGHIIVGKGEEKRK